MVSFNGINWYNMTNTTNVTDAEEPFRPLAYAERTLILDAARKAHWAYPGPVGEVIRNELYSWNEFGYRFGGYGLISRLIEDINKNYKKRMQEIRDRVSGDD